MEKSLKKMWISFNNYLRSKYFGIAMLIGFALGLLLPVLFPILLDMEIKMYDGIEYLPDEINHVSSVKPALPGRFIFTICLFGGLVGGYVVYLFSHFSQNRK